jgi:hypothetical protein
MAQTINGFAYRNPAEAALARRGIDPAGVKPAAKAESAGAQALSTSQPTAQTTEPARMGRGRFVNLLA